MKRRRSPAYYKAIAWNNPHWQALRIQRYQAQGGRCAVCHLPLGKRFAAHHLHYRTLGRETKADIVCVHHACHKIADRLRRAKRR